MTCYTAPTTDPSKSFQISTFPSHKALLIDTVLNGFGSVACKGVRGWVPMSSMELVFENPYLLATEENYNHGCFVGSEAWNTAGGRSDVSGASDGTRISLQSVGNLLGGSGGMMSQITSLIGGSPD